MDLFEALKVIEEIRRKSAYIFNMYEQKAIDTILERSRDQGEL